MKTIIECFETILSGDKEESRQAARRVRKLLYSSQGEPDKYTEIKELVNNAPDDSLPASPYKSVQMVLAELKNSCG